MVITADCLSAYGSSILPQVAKFYSGLEKRYLGSLISFSWQFDSVTRNQINNNNKEMYEETTKKFWIKSRM
jgi:hypothetical protein